MAADSWKKPRMTAPAVAMKATATHARMKLRISNFLLWQIAYAEIWVTDVLWPDFRRRHLLQAVADYQKRERRYGGIVPA